LEFDADAFFSDVPKTTALSEKLNPFGDLPIQNVSTASTTRDQRDILDFFNMS